MDPVRVYICHAAEDGDSLQALMRHLEPQVRAGRLSVWHRGMLVPGEVVQAAVKEQLRGADIIVLLVSADLLARRPGDLDLAQQEHARRAAELLPILLRPVHIAGSQLAGLHFLPADGEALNRRDDRDEAWVEVLAALQQRIEKRRTGGQPTAVAQARGQAVAPAGAGAIRILFLGANPSDQTQLALGQEVRQIDQALQLGAHRERFELIQEWAVNAGELSQKLLRHRPALIHFSGHGGQDGRILLEDAHGRGQPVPRAALAKLFGLFATKGLRGVILNACYARDQAEEIVRHIDCAVGISRALSDGSAIAFSVGFYTALAAGEPLRSAHAFGCVQLGLLGLPEEDAPALLTRSGVEPDSLRLL